MNNKQYHIISILIVCLGLLPSACSRNQTTVSPEQLEASQAFKDYPLPINGPYQVAWEKFSFQDPDRDNREVNVHVWYPAILPKGNNPGVLLKEGKPDMSGAPYPLILSSTRMARDLAPYLVSRGFTWVSVDDISTYMKMNPQTIEQPLDILFALEQAGSNQLEGLNEIIDAERAGTIGYSFDGYNSLAMSGARIDPEFYFSLCENPDEFDFDTELTTFSCAPAQNWDEFASHAPERITSSEDGLWQPMTDERIRAVIPMAGEGLWLFGERGLAAVDRPTLIIVATRDELYPENVEIYKHLGTPEKTLISFVGLDHMMVYDELSRGGMAYFALAFFGYHLDGREGYDHYFSEDFVNQHEDQNLRWGIETSD